MKPTVGDVALAVFSSHLGLASSLLAGSVVACALANGIWAFLIFASCVLPATWFLVRPITRKLDRESAQALGVMAILAILLAVPIWAVMSGPPAPRARDEAEAIATARRARIEADAARRYSDWQQQRKVYRRYLTPSELAEVIDEEDHWDSMDRASRAGRRLGEALRNK